MLFVNNIAMGLTGILLLYSCYTDIRYRQIKNICTAVILLLSLITGICSGKIHFLVPFVFLILGFLLTSVGVIGAGDIKLIFALLPSIPVEYTGRFFLLMCIPGIPVTLFILFIATYVFRQGEKTVPFGVAVACGYASLIGGGYV